METPWIRRMAVSVATNPYQVHERGKTVQLHGGDHEARWIQEAPHPRSRLLAPRRGHAFDATWRPVMVAGDFSEAVAVKQTSALKPTGPALQAGLAERHVQRHRFAGRRSGAEVSGRRRHGVGAIRS
jgi:hypothetical protein